MSALPLQLASGNGLMDKPAAAVTAATADKALEEAAAAPVETGTAQADSTGLNAEEEPMMPAMQPKVADGTGLLGRPAAADAVLVGVEEDPVVPVMLLRAGSDAGPMESPATATSVPSAPTSAGVSSCHCPL